MVVPLVAEIVAVPGSSAGCEARLGGADGRWVWVELTVTNRTRDHRHATESRRS
jgi:hypothetical protein